MKACTQKERKIGRRAREKARSIMLPQCSRLRDSLAAERRAVMVDSQLA